MLCGTSLFRTPGVIRLGAGPRLAACCTIHQPKCWGATPAATTACAAHGTGRAKKKAFTRACPPACRCCLYWTKSLPLPVAFPTCQTVATSTAKVAATTTEAPVLVRTVGTMLSVLVAATAPALLATPWATLVWMTAGNEQAQMHVLAWCKYNWQQFLRSQLRNWRRQCLHCAKTIIRKCTGPRLIVRTLLRACRVRWRYQCRHFCPRRHSGTAGGRNWYRTGGRGGVGAIVLVS